MFISSLSEVTQSPGWYFPAFKAWGVNKHGSFFRIGSSTRTGPRCRVEGFVRYCQYENGNIQLAGKNFTSSKPYHLGMYF
jgi:hypothetical protein